MRAEPCISILGLGLMGASLALALRKRGYAGRLAAYARKADTRREALERGIVDAAYDQPAAAAEEAGLVVLCAPIRACADLAVEIAPALNSGALVTDVGSTKGWICRQMAERLPAGTFVGSHPIAGSEKQGLQAASADLYRAIGRDRAGEVGAFCGTGFYDSTRVASGSIDMWNDILRTNAPAVAEELRAFKTEVEQVYDDLQAGRFAEVAAFLERARDARADLLKGRRR